MMVWLSAAMVLATSYSRCLAFGAQPLRPPAGPGGLAAGGPNGVGHPVVLAVLPDDRVGVVLAAVVDSHPHLESEGGLTVTDGLAAVGVCWSAGTPKSGLSRSKTCSSRRRY
jgi:hypothetical protein